jgi:hypothetical protein
MPAKTIVSVVLALGLVGIRAGAQDYNQSVFMSAGHGAKVNAAIAGARVNSDPLKEGCSGNLNAGNIVVPPGEDVPEEVVVVIQGDVINVSNGSGPRGCD